MKLIKTWKRLLFLMVDSWTSVPVTSLVMTWVMRDNGLKLNSGRNILPSCSSHCFGDKFSIGSLYLSELLSKSLLLILKCIKRTPRKSGRELLSNRSSMKTYSFDTTRTEQQHIRFFPDFTMLSWNPGMINLKIDISFINWQVNYINYIIIKIDIWI